MVVSVKLQAPLGTSLKSLVKGYLLTHQTQGSSPNTVEYYWGMLNRLLWYAAKENWPDDARLLTEWHVREFLGYVGIEPKRWDREGNGSESSSHKASPRTVHHYYSVLRSFFNWVVREDFLSDSRKESAILVARRRILGVARCVRRDISSVQPAMLDARHAHCVANG